LTRDEKNPIERAGDLPVPEVGDHGSFQQEPEHGDAEAREPELERLDLTADEPPEDEPA
jgi:hypothetical protein